MGTEKRQAALKALAATGMWRINYAPPMWRLLWRLGIDVPPPHFAPRRTNAVMFGAILAAGMGVLYLFSASLRQDRPLRELGFEIAFAAVIFGWLMAFWVEREKREHQLPRWSDLPQ